MAKIIDLTPCNFFLWEFVKSRVYANNPTTIRELKAAIRHVIGEIEQQTFEKIIKNVINFINIKPGVPIGTPYTFPENIPITSSDI